MGSEDKKNETKVFNKEELGANESQESNKPKRRKDVKSSKKKEKDKDKEKGKRRNGKIRGRIRYIPVWLRVVLVLVFCAAAFIYGLSFGYTVIGDGEDKDVVLDTDFWNNLWLYIQGK